MRRWLPLLLLTLLAPGLWAGGNAMEPMPCGYDFRNGSADPAGYVDGMSLYAGYFAPNALDPFGLRSHAEAMAWITSNLPTLKTDINGNCKALIGALSSIYVELRRGSDAKDTAREASSFMYTTMGNLGNSYGSEAFKPKDAEPLIDADKTGMFADIQKLQKGSKEYRLAVYDVLLNHPGKIAIARTQFYIDQWDAARKLDPTVADISNNAGVLATLYNLGPAKSAPKANPQFGGTWFTEDSNGNLIDSEKGVSGAKSYGEYAHQFSLTPEAKDVKEKCGCPGAKK